MADILLRSVLFKNDVFQLRKGNDDDNNNNKKKKKRKKNNNIYQPYEISNIMSLLFDT